MARQGKTPPLPAHTRATRGAAGFNHQPRLRFGFRVPARLTDGNAMIRGEKVGNEQQGYLGPVIRDKIPYLATTSRADLFSAFNKRVNYSDPSSVDPYIRSRAIKMIKKLVPVKWPKIQWDRELFNDWIGQFDSEKQDRMQRAYDIAGLETLKDYSTKEIFTKIEALVKDPEQVAPRVIFKGTDFYNMTAGPIVKVLMERFVQLENQLDEVKFKVAYKQHTPDLVEFLEKRPCKSFIEADFSSNDKTQVKDVHQLESILMQRLGAPSWFVRIHKASNRFSVLNTKYGISAVIENQLATGAVDTTFRNTFWNLVIFYSWCCKYRVKGALACFLGDDMVAGLPRRVRRSSKHYQYVARMARMIAKVTTAPTLHEMHFLSKHFVPVCRGEQMHVMLPFIGKVLAKFNSRANSNEAVSDDEYMAGKALSHCYEYRFCHVLRDCFVNRANYHLERTGGRYSLEGVTWHVRVHATHKGVIESMIEGSTSWPDLVSTEDLTLFWLGMCDLTFGDLYPSIRTVIENPHFVVLDDESLQHLVDY